MADALASLFCYIAIKIENCNVVILKKERLACCLRVAASSNKAIQPTLVPRATDGWRSVVMNVESNSA
jgi:hypothetical protein